MQSAYRFPSRRKLPSRTTAGRSPGLAAIRRWQAAMMRSGRALSLAHRLWSSAARLGPHNPAQTTAIRANLVKNLIEPLPPVEVPDLPASLRYEAKRQHALGGNTRRAAVALPSARVVNVPAGRTASAATAA